MKLRRAGPDDVPLIARVHFESWRAAYRGVVPDSYLDSFTVEKREAAFKRHLAEREGEYYLVEDQGHAIGLLSMGVCSDPDLKGKNTGELRALYLMPDRWRQGVGTLAIREAERMLLARGHQQVVLWVLKVNAAARRFYEAVGYWKDGATKTVEWGQPLESLRYVKTLLPAV
jgi:GNAT superfamily N-acetyltransferase